MFRIAALAGMGLLAGCASLPPDMAVDSPVYNQANAGLVVGSLSNGGPYGTFLEFRNLASGALHGWGPKDDYAVWLPAGEYEVAHIGNRRGVMGPYTRPLHFTVKQGQVNYVGEMVYDCSDLARPTAMYGVKYCGLLALGRCSVSSPDVNICVVDRQRQAIKYFQRQHPEQSSLPVHRAFMK